MINNMRRSVLKGLGLGASVVGAGGLSACVSTKSEPSVKSDWDKQVDAIRQQVVEPTFPNKDYLITQYGAKGDGQFDNTLAIKQAIQACAANGGGRVVVPAGHFLTGPVHLESNINLHISQGATLAFIPEPERYLPAVFTRWEGVELMGYSPLIYAFKKKNVAVTGQGTLEGGGSNDIWWPWKGKWKKADWPISDTENQKHTRDALFQMAEDGVPVEQRVFDKNYLRPPFIQPYHCENVLIEGVTIKNSPFWLVNPVLCQSVTVRGVHCISYGPNSDGCDPESCKNVLIEDCIFDTGDDCIAIKSGRNADGRRVAVPCENLIVDNCKMKEGHGGVVIGSEISGGVRNLYAQNCEMSSPHLKRGIRIKTNSIRGGVLENLNYRNIEIGQVSDAIVVNFLYEEGDAGPFKPTVRNVNISNLIVKNAKRAFVLRGFSHTPISGVSLENVSFIKVEKDSIVEHVKQIDMKNVKANGKPFTL
ncbi:glycoside hydrolase (plasmid) [Saccharobesus litoralis]|uniref:Glycoside hydrolase n=1 Tax=Saccharobesus litoralis TaxID=2172099 RepID=A0A2S0VYB9_9ALTE|nr:glycoside hydrolase family 28 protein [Saccharobesus litoralis]AWB69201.1 glycoside hydrolase [Saccharobesus litoralis]